MCFKFQLVPLHQLKNFLTTSLEPGMESFVVMGAVSHCEGFELEVSELTIPSGAVYKLNAADPQLEAPGFQPLSLLIENLVSIQSLLSHG
jgi:hypothetical protein